MNIENEVFKRGNINYSKLIKYGFKKSKDIYTYEKKFLHNNFKAIISINNKGIVCGKVIDLQFEEEYTNIKSKMHGEFVDKVRDEYKNILIDIKNNCFESTYFINEQTNKVVKYINDKYNVKPEFLWKKYPFFGVFRNKDNGKWFALITNVDKSKITNENGEIELINVKLDKNKIKLLLKNAGFYEAYHMNKTNWISIILNDTINSEDIFELINESYNLINKKD